MSSPESKKFIVRYRNNLYDLTEFARKHPGGINTLKGLENSDMTKRFLSGPEHSNAAKYLMQEYKIRTSDSDNNNTINFDIDESMEHLVDWSKPMIPQIAQIVEYYDEWVHKPVDRPLRLFGPWYLEICTKTPWWFVPLFWIPNITYLLYTETFSIHNKDLKTLALISYFISGIFVWTFVEYILHRFVFHMNTNAKNRYLCTFHFLMHGLHHKVPFDSYRLVFPPLPALILASIIYIPIAILFKHSRIIFSGGLLGYLIYDLIHYYLHFGNPRIWQLYQMKRYHYQHHFAHQNIGFGISSSLWDYVFNTQICLRKLKYILRWKL